MVSVIIPTRNEINNKLLWKSIQELKTHDNIELIIVDSFSNDGSTPKLKKLANKFIQVETNSRAIRLNEGIKNASHEIIIMHHPRSFLEKSAIECVIELYRKDTSDYLWGAFTHKFNIQHPLLQFTSFYSNSIRGRRSIFYLDHCLFATKKHLLEVGLIPEVDIFEDTEICLRLRKNSKAIRLSPKSITSAIRFEKNGIYQQALKNQILKIRYYFSFNHKKMNDAYEKNLNLNSDYTNES